MKKRLAFGPISSVLCAVLVFGFWMAGCKTAAPTDTVEATVLPADNPEVPVVETPPTGQLPTGANAGWPSQEELAISLQTTPCMGTCPVYRLEVFRDGTLRYQASQFTERIGTYRGKVSSARMAAIFDLAKDMQFALLEDVYPTGNIRIMDLPSSILYLSTDQWQKQVVSRRYANPDAAGEQAIVDQLRDLQVAIDALLQDTPLQLVGEARQD